MALAAAAMAGLALLAPALAAGERFKGPPPMPTDVHEACPAEVDACQRDAECRELLGKPAPNN